MRKGAGEREPIVIEYLPTSKVLEPLICQPEYRSSHGRLNIEWDPDVGLFVKLVIDNTFESVNGYTNFVMVLP